MSVFIARAGEFHQWAGFGETADEVVAGLLRPTPEMPGLAGKVASTRTLDGSEVVVRFHGWGLESEPTQEVRAPLVVKEYQD